MKKTYIGGLSLKNFKAFRNETLQLKPLTLFTGMNGTGKSSFIQSMLLFRQAFQKQLLPESLALVGDYVDLGRGKDVMNIHSEEDELYFRLQWTDGAYMEAIYAHNPEADTLQNKKFKSSEGLFEQKNLFTNAFQYLNADRQPPKSFFPTSTYQVEKLRSLGNRGEYTAHFISYYKFQKLQDFAGHSKLIHPKAKGPELINQLSAWLSEITPGISIVSTTIDDLDIAKLGFEFEMDTEKTPVFRPTNVGFGFTHVLPILTALLSARPGDLLIIENPESHLHPLGQVVLGRLIAMAASAGVQIILESHSDHILNSICVAVKKEMIAADDTAIYFIERSAAAEKHFSSTVKPTILPNGRLDRYPKGFFDEYDRQLDELLSD